MAAVRIEVRGKPEGDKLRVEARADGKTLISQAVKDVGVAREKFGISHGQNGHKVYEKEFGVNYYVADLLDDGEWFDEPKKRAAKKKSSKRRR